MPRGSLEVDGLKKRENVSLAMFTSFNIGGRAKYFFEEKSKEEIIKAVLLAQQLGLPFFILGGGSNVLVSDKGFNGLVIKIRNTKYEIRNTKSLVGAGMMLGKLVEDLAEKGLSGLEWAIGIPGTLGGAIYGNAGAFGKSMKDIVKKVEVFDAKDLRLKIYDLGDCRFGYRESIFKKDKNLIILSAVLELKKQKKEEIKKKIKQYLNYRKEIQPLGLPSAGSIFKNPPDLSAGELIERCGLKGIRFGRAKVSEKHANFIVNLGGARSGDVKGLINLIKKKVRARFGIELQEELQYLGF